MKSPIKQKNKQQTGDTVGINKSPNPLQATSLRTAVGNLNEQTSLIFEDRKEIPVSASASFYVERKDNPMDELKTYLLTSQGDDKILFSGHMGSGKSTELNRFASLKEIRDKFLVIKYSISEILNIIDIDYIDFLLSFVAYLYIKASDEGISFTPQVLKSIEGWMDYFKSGVKDFDPEPEEINPAKKIYRFFKRVSVILLRELTLRDNIREIVRRNITSLMKVIDTLIQFIATRLDEKELLIIIDDLEKIPDITRAEKLFIDAGSYMTLPRCKIIYTIPIALFYSIKFKRLSNVFSNSYILPNIKVRERMTSGSLLPGPIDPTGCMKKFLEKRVDLRLINTDAAEMAIENSGGVAREFVRILKNSCVKAISKGFDTIETDTVQAVVTQLRNEYERGFEKRHFDVLKAVQAGSPVEDYETQMELFHSKVLLEYVNGHRWVDINPVVKPMIK